jgi:D-alanyl-D-alanine carboxypeptidase
VIAALPVTAYAQRVVPQPSPVAVKLGSRPDIKAAEALLIDLSDAGQVLYSRNTHTSRAPASLTKVVTALVVRDQYNLDEIATADDHVRVSQGTIGITPGLQFSVRDLLYAMLLPSANDAAAVLAAHDPYGYDHFIALMNQKARALGAYGSYFVNPHGLDEPGHVSTAWDMAIFARQLLADPVLAEVVRTKHFGLHWPDGTTRVLTNHNFLLGRYPGMVGMKTGYTVKAGHGLISAVQTPTSLYVSVVMGSPNPYGETAALMDYAKAFELGSTPGGGGPDLPAAKLSLPPAAPAVDAMVRLPSAPLAKDPRDEPTWAILMSVLAAVTAGSLVLRRRPGRLREAARFYPALEAIVPRDRRA